MITKVSVDISKQQVDELRAFIKKHTDGKTSEDNLVLCGIVRTLRILGMRDIFTALPKEV